jgi:hypothetical protein
MPGPRPTSPRAAARRPHDQPPGGPTDALPGTPEKLAALIARHQRGQALWQPQDSGLTAAAAAVCPRRRGRGRKGA